MSDVKIPEQIMSKGSKMDRSVVITDFRGKLARPSADEAVPVFVAASLVPTEAMYVCPCCSFASTVSLVEDDSGECIVPMEHRFVQCENCDANIDIGWAGWHWHDARSPHE